MFPRSLRLSRMGFEKSRGLSRTVTPHFSLSYGSLPSCAGIGIIVPKKVVKGAVQRHQLKRRLREIMRAMIPTNPHALTVIISVRKGAAELSFEEIRSELSNAFRAILPETI